MEETVTTTAETTEEQTTPEIENNSQSDDVQTTENSTTESEKSEVETIETESQEPTKEPVKDWEQIAKDNQAAFTKVTQELAELKKQVEQNKPKLVQEGKINPQFEMQYKAQVDDMEFRTYDNLARQLEPETRSVVENLLGEAYRLYNPNNKNAYYSKLNEIKDYFRSDIVIGIENERQKRLSQIENTFNQELAKDRKQRADRIAQEVKAIPELSSLLLPESENYSPEVFDIVRTMFDSTGTVDVQAMSKTISKIKELGVKEYLAKQSAQKVSDKATVPESETVIQKSSMPSAEDIRNTPGLYTKLAKKYGQAKIDAILMKG